jgi:hypothetical protein
LPAAMMAMAMRGVLDVGIGFNIARVTVVSRY